MRPLLCIALLALFACDGTKTEQPPSYPDEWTPTETEEEPAPEVAPAPSDGRGKTARRLTVDQLRRSIPQLFGDLDWTTRFRDGEADLFELLSRTLGEADYQQVTESNVEPNPLFAKFMADMAGQLCRKAGDADERTPNAADRRIVPYPADVDRNLRWLRLKFHGIYVPEGGEATDDGLRPLRTLYDEIEAEADSKQAWLGVCIALVTAPEFMAY
jgi:hypothetical protein